MARQPNTLIVPKAFFSYAHFNDEHEDQRLSQLRHRLQGEIRSHCGIQIEVFQDVKMAWGDNWRKEIERAVKGSCFFIPVVTPSFFGSEVCREELECFLAYQEKLTARLAAEGGTGAEMALGVVLPIYWIEADELSDPAWRESNEMAQQIAACQYTDWRKRRLEPLESIESARLLESMAKDVKRRLKAMGVLKPPAKAGGESAGGVGVLRGLVGVGAGGVGAGGVGAGGVGDKSADTSPTPRVQTEASTGELSAAGKPEAGPSPLPRHRVLVVDIGGKGGFRSVADAMRAAQPEQTILVRPGEYTDAVVMDKAVTLIGDGRREDIVLRVKDAHVIMFTATFGRVANVTLRQGGGAFYGVDIRAGRLELEDCDICSDGYACVAVRDGADPMVRGNRIHDGKSAGVIVYDKGRGTIENNDIFANALAGVDIKTEGDPVVRGNRIHDGKEGGVLVYDKGRGTIENNDIFANALAGVAVKTEGDPVLRGNRIHDGKQGGVMVHGKGGGTIENNDIFANALAGVEIRTEAEPLLRGNRIHDGKQSGVFVNEKGRGTIENNDIFANMRAGVVVQEEGDPVVRGNRIQRNHREAIRVHTNGRGQFVSNDLRDNKLGPWNIASDCAVNVVRTDNIEK